MRPTAEPFQSLKITRNLLACSHLSILQILPLMFKTNKLLLLIYAVVILTPFTLSKADDSIDKLIEALESQALDPADIFDNLVDSGIQFTPDQNNILETRTIVITTGINANSSRKIINAFLSLDRHNPGEPITLYIRTEGGWTADAFSIISVMHFIESPVNVYAMGEVHSSGAMILASATGERVSFPETIIGYHGMSESDTGLHKKRLITFWKTYGNLPKKWLKNTDDEIFSMTAKDALKYGIIDRIAKYPSHSKRVKK